MAIPKIKVLIVNNCQFARDMFKSLLELSPEIEIVGSLENPDNAIHHITTLRPDVVILEIEMLLMDGISFFKRIMSLHPLPVIMISDEAHKGKNYPVTSSETQASRHLSPRDIRQDSVLTQKSHDLISEVKMALWAHIRAERKTMVTARSIKSILPGIDASTAIFNKPSIIAMGASTGGVELIGDVLGQLPSNVPPIVLVQHMPETFTANFANSLNKKCVLNVFEAYDNAVVNQGDVVIARGDKHLTISRKRGKNICTMGHGENINGHRPSVDVLFYSIARGFGPNALGVIMTGMGNDGANGLLAMREAGAITIGQDLKSSVVYGMPKKAFDLGAVMHQVSAKNIAHEIRRLINPVKIAV